MKHKRIFATWYLQCVWEDLLATLGDLYISQGCEAADDSKTEQYDGIFPENGAVIIVNQNKLKTNPVERWKLTLEADSNGLEDDRYWLSPVSLDEQTWDKTFEKELFGEADDWGIR